MARRDQASLPGSWRGAPPQAGPGVGSGAGPRGPIVRRNGGTVSPPVVGLLLLLGAEIAGYVTLRYVFRTAHGG